VTEWLGYEQAKERRCDSPFPQTCEMGFKE